MTDEATILAYAALIGERIDLRALASSSGSARLGTTPLTVPVPGGGRAVLFRYGAVVFLDVAPVQRAAFIEQLQPFVREPLTPPETESLEIRCDAGTQDRIEQGVLIVPDERIERLQLVADVLGKSVALARYETRIADTFDRIEPLAADLRRTGRGSYRGRHLVRYIGDTLLAMHRMVGRVEVSEKPDLLWDHPALEGLYLRLEDEFEIKERHLALERKLDVVSRTAETLLDLLQTKRSLRVEWYITLLIVVEIIISLYEMFGHAH